MYVRLSAALAALLSIPNVAAAQASLRVEPLRVVVSAPSQASAITLQNTSAEKVSVQIRVFEWSQANGKDTLTPTTDVVVSPPATTIPGGASYTIRVARTAGAVASGEKSYRLWVDELPAAERKRAEARTVDILIRYDLPVFFGTANASSRLSWKAYKSGGRLLVEATNTGTGHARVEALAVGNVSFGSGLNGYVLPGSMRRWTSAANTPLPATNANLTLVAEVGDREVRAPITIASN
ncbi:molecular chaperone [Novosphingobium panipatense]|jgi:fimbrial chaperone protein|uniref:fimbrial biogenesis chaperone n=1 Tax=Novosphingobium TaxID=165696 RepID=UPI000CDAFD3A|nr:fimbria/pilus periplasmic chaperone [Novosphingobium sp. HII-3]